MALRFCDSFDHYAYADIDKKWTALLAGAAATGSGFSTGRNSTSGVRLTATNYTPRLSKVFSNISGTTCIVGMAVKAVTIPTPSTPTGENNQTGTPGQNQALTLLSIRYQGTTHTWFGIGTTGLIRALRTSTLLGTSSSGLTLNAWHYVEFKVLLHDSTGTVTVKIDGEQVLALTSQDTAATTVAWDEVCIGAFPNGSDIYVDDVIIMDGSGSYNNDFMGDHQVRVLLPNAVGNSSGSTASGGAVDRYTMVDEASMNSDTDYNSFAAVSDKDTYGYAACPTSGATVAAVVANPVMRKADAGAATAVAVARISSTDYDGAASLYPASTYLMKQQIWERSAVDGTTAWTTTVIDAAEFGLKKTA